MPGTSNGNYGRSMYSDPKWRRKIAVGHVYKRINIKKICSKCNNIFIIERKIDKNGNEVVYNKEKKYCFRKCANSHVQTKEINDKRAIKLRKKQHKIHYIECKFCHKIFIGKLKSRFCSRKCVNLMRRIELDEYNKYKANCQFKFSLNEYKNRFNFLLIEKFGWYKAKNRGNNLKGISRDHIISINYGFENNISPEIISHPANCQLLRHNENISKGKKCGLTLDQLLDKIAKWDCGVNGNTSDLQSEDPSSSLGYSNNSV